ncbi:hypothetical protein bmyco0003_18680 [Bacillus pseudomycoides]|nr:hypothetical protein bmyco0003_18680 [Bacillus pseudomycoides]
MYIPSFFILPLHKNLNPKLCGFKTKFDQKVKTKFYSKSQSI